MTPPTEAPRTLAERLRASPTLLGAAIGVLYAIPMRIVFSAFYGGSNAPMGGWGDWLVGAMSTAFLVAVPAATGALVVAFATDAQPLTLPQAFFRPWAACLAAVLAATAFLLEGTICIVLASPLFFLMGSVGGVLARAVLREKRSGASRFTIAFLPLAWGAAEARTAAPEETFRVENVRVIAAPPATVWRHVSSVEAIAPEELPWSPSHAIGLPRPIAATLSHPGVGGVRRATFDRGLVFAEEVTAWEPERTIAFGIRAEHAPPEALDEHVVVGGRYFDVLEGRYTLVDRGDGRTEVRLTSTHRLTTTLNGYAGLWSRAIMWDLQRVILEVVAHRCEAARGPRAGVASEPPGG